MTHAPYSNGFCYLSKSEHTYASKAFGHKTERMPTLGRTT